MPNGVEGLNRLPPKAGCVCWKEPPNELVWAVLAPKLPKAGFCPNGVPVYSEQLT